MESLHDTPIHPPESMSADTQAHARRQVGRRALGRVYEDGDAYSDLGGGLRPYRPVDEEVIYPTGRTETILFADSRQRELVDPRHAEILRAYELSLDQLSSSQFHQLSLKDQLRVAVAGHDVIATTESRARVLQTDGNYAHPAFQHYGFESQAEASQYANELIILQHDLMTRDVVNDIELTYRALKSKSRPATMAALKKQTRDLTISINDDGKVTLANKASAK